MYLGLLTLISALVVLPIGERVLQVRRPNVIPELNAESDEAPALGNEHAFWVRAAITFVILSAALFVILSGRYAEDQQKWAYGAVGTIVGFWLRT